MTLAGTTPVSITLPLLRAVAARVDEPVDEEPEEDLDDGHDEEDDDEPEAYEAPDDVRPVEDEPGTRSSS